MRRSSRGHPDKLRLIDLPKGVLVHICRMLRIDGSAVSLSPIRQRALSFDTFAKPPLAISLRGLNKFFSPLPPHLLPVAQSCRALAAAVAELLGGTAIALNANNAKTRLLPEWVIALRNHVKAVSAWDQETVDVVGIRHPHLSWDSVFNDGKRLLKALREAAIPLQVLDLSNVELHKVEKDMENMVGDLRATMMAAKYSLRELSLPVSHIVERVLSQVAFSCLQTLNLHFKAILELVERVETHGASGLLGFADMLQAIEGRLGGGSKICELRLCSVLEAPFSRMDDPNYCPRVCAAVTSMEIENSPWLYKPWLYKPWLYENKPKDEDDNIALFISLFPSLKRLKWNGDVTPSRIQTIIRACSSLEQLVLEPYKRFEPWSEHSNLFSHVRNAAMLPDIFIATQGKLRSLKLKGKMTVEQWKTLAESSPLLETLETEIGQSTVGALVPLLGTYCRCIRRLHVWLSDNSRESLSGQGWTTFANAVQGASAKLKEVSLVCETAYRPVEVDVEEMVAAMVAIMECLGDRATVITFRAPTATFGFHALLTAMIRLVRAAARYVRNVEHLCFELALVDADYDWGGDGDMASQLWQDVLNARRELRENTPRLQTLYMDRLDQEGAEYFEGLGYYPLGAQQLSSVLGEG